MYIDSVALCSTLLFIYQLLFLIITVVQSTSEFINSYDFRLISSSELTSFHNKLQCSKHALFGEYFEAGTSTAIVHFVTSVHSKFWLQYLSSKNSGNLNIKYQHLIYKFKKICSLFTYFTLLLNLTIEI